MISHTVAGGVTSGDFRYEDGLWKMNRLRIILDCMTTLERGEGMLAKRILPFPARGRLQGPYTYERIRMMLPTLDAYTPREIAHKIETLGVTKARSDPLSLLVLAVLAGAFIALGALFFTVVVTRSALGFGVSRLVGGWRSAWG